MISGGFLVIRRNPPESPSRNFRNTRKHEENAISLPPESAGIRRNPPEPEIVQKLSGNCPEILDVSGNCPEIIFRFPEMCVPCLFLDSHFSASRGSVSSPASSFRGQSLKLVANIPGQNMSSRSFLEECVLPILGVFGPADRGTAP